MSAVSDYSIQDHNFFLRMIISLVQRLGNRLYSYIMSLSTVFIKRKHILDKIPTHLSPQFRLLNSYFMQRGRDVKSEEIYSTSILQIPFCDTMRKTCDINN
jgi:hypothetical protein